MKKIVAATILGVAVLLVGCTGESLEGVEDSSVRFAGMKGSVTIVVDNETGCQYIREGRGLGENRTVGITPLMRNPTEVECGQNNRSR